MTLAQQAEFLDYLVTRCIDRNGNIAGETMMTMTDEQTADLKYIADRLHHMAPHASAIRRVVLGS